MLEYGVKYPDVSRVVRCVDKEGAELLAKSNEGAVVVFRSVTDWREVD